MPVTRCARRRRWPPMPRSWAIAATGWPSIIRCRALPVPRLRSRWRMSRIRPARSGLARAGSCCPTTARCRSPSSSGRWPRSTRGESTWGWAARLAPTRPQPLRCAATCRAMPMIFLAMWSSCCAISRRRAIPLPASAPSPAKGWKCRCGYWDRALMARNSRRSLACPTPLHRTSRPTCWTRRFTSIAAISVPRSGSTSRM